MVVKNLHRGVLMVVNNLTLMLCYGGEKPYTEALSWW